MDGHKQIDDEIAALLAVEPSPEFLASVRARVAREPEPAAWRWSWLVATAGAVAMVIVAVMVWPSGESAPSNRASEPSPQVAEAVAPPAPVTVEVERPRAPRRAGPTIRARETANLTPMISADDARAFELLLSTIRQGDVVLVLGDDRSDSALSASTLAIAPITIEPVPAPETLEGGVE